MTGLSRIDGRRHGSGIRLSAWAVLVALLLLVPLVAMQITEEVNWNLFDFVFAGAVLFGSAVAYELWAARGGTSAYRAAAAIAVAAALALVWINAAVGIIGDDEAYNRMYFAVLAVGIVGAWIARLRPSGMARVLKVMAVVQMLVPLTVLAVPGFRPVLWEPPGAVGVFLLNAVFAAMWVASALLFRKAAQQASTQAAAS